MLHTYKLSPDYQVLLKLTGHAKMINDSFQGFETSPVSQSVLVE